ncbi:MAG: YesL family protein [Lachnospiraceae bacterium]|nr:YesL family protein [Lachnospiraceae bacterium]
MEGFFNMDSKWMKALSKLFDLMLVNILTLLCSIPIITIGASFSAMHFMMYRLYKNDEGYIIRSYFGFFKKNFRQSTLMWLVYLLILLILGIDQYVLNQGVLELNSVIQIVVIIIAVIWLISFVWVFVMQSRYLNPIRITMKNSMLVGLTHPIRTVLMIIVFLLPIPVMLLISWGLPICILFGLTVPAYIQCRMYAKVFAQIEGTDKDRENNGENSDSGWLSNDDDFVQ